jgi:hypothetical protein
VRAFFGDSTMTSRFEPWVLLVATCVPFLAPQRRVNSAGHPCAPPMVAIPPDRELGRRA